MTGRYREWAATAAVVTLAVLVLALVAEALHHRYPPPESGMHLIVVASGAVPAVRVTPSAGPSARPQATASRPSSSPPMLVSLVVGYGVAIRAASYLGCADGPPAVVSVSRDEGNTWTSVGSPALHVLRLHLTGTQSGWAVGANGSCHVNLYHTGSLGQTWAGPSDPTGTWHLTADGLGVVSPTRPVKLPCVPRSTLIATPVDADVAYLACAASLYVTTDGGAAWSRVVGYFGGPVAAMDFLDAQAGVVISSGESGCAGLVSRTTADGGRHWVRGGCVPAAAPLAVGIHDTSHFLAVSFASGRFLAFVSADSGLTWRAQ